MTLKLGINLPFSASATVPEIRSGRALTVGRSRNSCSSPSGFSSKFVRVKAGALIVQRTGTGGAEGQAKRPSPSVQAFQYTASRAKFVQETAILA
jgi:hypothetical protein